MLTKLVLDVVLCLCDVDEQWVVVLPEFAVESGGKLWLRAVRGDDVVEVLFATRDSNASTREVYRILTVHHDPRPHQNNISDCRFFRSLAHNNQDKPEQN